MFKQALRSYVTSLHPRNFRKIKDTSGMFLWFYWLLINPAIMEIERTGEWKFKVFFWITTITPFYMMWWSNLGYKLSMSKLMYLLPLKTEERKRYLTMLLLIKIGFPVVVGIVLHIVFAMIYGMAWWRIIICAVCTCSFGIGMYVCSELRSKFNRYIRYAVRGKDGTGKDAWLNWICMIYSVIVMLFFRMAEYEGEMESFMENMWIIGIVGICIVMDVIIIKTRYKDAIEDVCNYEKVFDVAGNGQGVPLGQMLKV